MHLGGFPLERVILREINGLREAAEGTVAFGVEVPVIPHNIKLKCSCNIRRVLLALVEKRHDQLTHRPVNLQRMRQM